MDGGARVTVISWLSQTLSMHCCRASCPHPVPALSGSSQLQVGAAWPYPAPIWHMSLSPPALGLPSWLYRGASSMYTQPKGAREGKPLEQTLDQWHRREWIQFSSFSPPYNPKTQASQGQGPANLSVALGGVQLNSTPSHDSPSFSVSPPCSFTLALRTYLP